MSIEKLEAKIKSHEEAISQIKVQIKKCKEDAKKAEEKAIFARLKSSGLSLSALDEFIKLQSESK